MKKLLFLLPLLAGCSHPTFSGPQTAESHYAALGPKGREAFDQGYNDAKADDIHRYYAMERNLMKYPAPGAVGKRSPELKTKLVALPVPAYKDGEGVVRDPGYKVIKIETQE